MDDELNITYITFQGYVDVHKYRYLYFVVMFTVYILIICFNVTILCLIVIHKNLHEPMYIFIAALLLNCCFQFCHVSKTEKQIISYSACLLQFVLYYTLSISEFLLLAAMSYDRYVSICKPLQHPTIMTKTSVTILLVSAWFVSACFSAVPAILSSETKLCNFTMKGIFCNNAIYELQCAQSRVIAIYGVVTLVALVGLPLLFILFTYIKILVIAFRSGREVRKKAAETCLPHLLVLINFSCLSIYDVSIARVEANLSKTARFIMTLQVILYHPLFNPLIYGLKMKEISKHLRKLFCADKVI